MWKCETQLRKRLTKIIVVQKVWEIIVLLNVNEGISIYQENLERIQAFPWRHGWMYSVSKRWFVHLMSIFVPIKTRWKDSITSSRSAFRRESALLGQTLVCYLSEKLELEKCVSLVKKRFDKKLQVTTIMTTESTPAFMLPSRQKSLKSGPTWWWCCVSTSPGTDGFKGRPAGFCRIKPHDKYPHNRSDSDCMLHALQPTASLWEWAIKPSRMYSTSK